jgi:hypothetical protein
MATSEGDFGGTALSTAWILHIVGITFTVVGIAALWFLYSFADAVAAAFGGSQVSIASVLELPTAGCVVAFGSALAYSLWARPTITEGPRERAPGRVAVVGVVTIVAGAFSLPAFILGGVLLVSGGVIYALVAWRVRNSRGRQAASFPAKLAHPYPGQISVPRSAPGATYPPAVWVRCTQCGKPCLWPDQRICPRCGLSLEATYA